MGMLIGSGVVRSIEIAGVSHGDSSLLLAGGVSYLLLVNGVNRLSIVDSASAGLRIMPLGDSITQGQNTSYGSYRRHLYDLLTDAGITVDFVGGLSDGAFADPDHEGHTGEGIVSIWARVETDHILVTHGPDLILLMIGTNDLWGFAESPATALGYYSSLLDAITAETPTVQVIVGSIPPIDIGDPTLAANVDVFNAGLETLVASKGANFFFADINSGMDTGDLADGVHPTDAGNDILAGLWFTAMQDAGFVAGFLVDGDDEILTDDDGNNLLAA